MCKTKRLPVSGKRTYLQQCLLQYQTQQYTITILVFFLQSLQATLENNTPNEDSSTNIDVDSQYSNHDISSLRNVKWNVSHVGIWDEQRRNDMDRGVYQFLNNITSRRKVMVTYFWSLDRLKDYCRNCDNCLKIPVDHIEWQAKWEMIIRLMSWILQAKYLWLIFQKRFDHKWSVQLLNTRKIFRLNCFHMMMSLQQPL